ncbi:MAG: phosphopantetheine-binding protein [Dysgonamonadaceae bacterium]|jgi:acyl carrier protein|nr:phosphopantetheine-binding protein [Dysgonamonadaceae bacterium]
MDKETIISKINAVLADEFEIDESIIKPDKPLMETLELDSLDLVDMVVLIENNFGYKMKAEDFVGMITFYDFYEFIFKKIQERENG